MSTGTDEAMEQDKATRNLHDFEPQREPFEYLCGECGMGKIAVYHTGSRFQFIVLSGRFKVVDRQSRNDRSGQIATADDEESANLITEALNERAALLARVGVLEEVLKPIIDCYGLGQSAEKFTEQVGPFIVDAKAALSQPSR